jgi:hypothetical protein
MVSSKQSVAGTTLPLTNTETEKRDMDGIQRVRANKRNWLDDKLHCADELLQQQFSFEVS